MSDYAALATMTRMPKVCTGLYRTKSPRSIVKLAGREDFIYWTAKRTREKNRSTLSQSADFWETVSHHLQKSCSWDYIEMIWCDCFEYSPFFAIPKHVISACRSASPLSLSWEPRDKKPRTHTTSHLLWQFQAPQWLLKPLHHFWAAYKIVWNTELLYTIIV